MVHLNNAIACAHFRKKWQRRVRTFFNQPMKKMRRRRMRAFKVIQYAPRPVKTLRPIVHCPTVRYNTKERIGRGFTVRELKRAGINKRFALTMGICVDHRRRNRCYESVARNAERLKAYKSKLIILVRKSKDVEKKSPLANTATDSGQNLNKLTQSLAKLQARVVSEEDRKFEAFSTLRKARSDENHWGLRQKRKLVKNDPFDAASK